MTICNDEQTSSGCIASAYDNDWWYFWICTNTAAIDGKKFKIKHRNEHSRLSNTHESSICAKLCADYMSMCLVFFRHLITDWPSLFPAVCTDIFTTFTLYYLLAIHALKSALFITSKWCWYSLFHFRRSGDLHKSHLVWKQIRKWDSMESFKIVCRWKLSWTFMSA